MLYRRLGDTYRKLWVIPKLHRTYGKLSAADAFSRIYESGLWSPTDGASYDSSANSIGIGAESYVRKVVEFINSRGIQSIADLGCGDFQVGRRITSRCDVYYVGVDIVQAMIAGNQISFGNDRIGFLCADLALDPAARRRPVLGSPGIAASLECRDSSCVGEHCTVQIRSYQ